MSFSIDEWMVYLFCDDAPEPLDKAWVAPRVARYERRIWGVAAQPAAVGLPVVLDLDLQAAEHRARHRDLATAQGLTTRIHHLDVPREERWRRVKQRKERRDGTVRLVVSGPMFDFMEQRFERPTSYEALGPGDALA